MANWRFILLGVLAVLLYSAVVFAAGFALGLTLAR
jgi:hypothetical protein